MRLKIDFSAYLRPRALAVSALMLAMIISFAIHFTVLLAAFVAICVVMLYCFSEDTRYVAREDRNFFALLIVACALTMPINVLRSPAVALHFCMVLACIAAAIVATRDRQAYATASFVVLVFGQGVVLAYLAVRGLGDFPLEDMIPDSSSNGITSYIVSLQINYAIANLRIRQKTALLTAGVTFFICIVGYGRGSILAATAIILISGAFLFQTLPRIYAAIGTVILFALGSIAIIENFQFFMDYADSNTKLSNGLFDESRASILDEYLQRMVGFDILFGADYKGTLIERFYNGNPHISYIRAHYIFGLPYLIVILLMAIRPLFSNIPVVERAFYLLMIATLLFRASTEPIFFPTPLDVMFFSIFIILGGTRRTGSKSLVGVNHGSRAFQ